MIQTVNRKAIAIGRRSRQSDPVDILAFLIPCLQIIQLHLIGVLSGSDLLLLATFVVLAFRGRIRITTPVGKTFLVLCSLWLASQCVTDIVRHTAFVDYARGWSNIGMTLVAFTVLWTLLYGRPRRLMIYGWGLVAGSLLTYFFKPDEFVRDYPWKFGLAYPVTLAVFLLASSEKLRNRWPIAMAAMIGLINVYLGARNRGGVCLAAALYLLVTLFLRRRRSESSELKARTVVALAASIIVGAAGIFWGYQHAASTGILGDNARTEYEGESAGKYGLLLGGRTELLAELPAIYDSPILGHGSWPRDPTYLILEIRGALALGYKDILKSASREAIAEGSIPTHSYLFGAWVDAGILGALFWGWAFVFTAKTLMRVYPATVALLPVASFMAFSMLWDILFSPYGATERIMETYYIVMLATCLAMAPHKAARAAMSTARRRTLQPVGGARHD